MHTQYQGIDVLLWHKYIKTHLQDIKHYIYQELAVQSLIKYTKFESNKHIVMKHILCIGISNGKNIILK
jgi:hypothetical protein